MVRCMTSDDGAGDVAPEHGLEHDPMPLGHLDPESQALRQVDVGGYEEFGLSSAMSSDRGSRA